MTGTMLILRGIANLEHPKGQLDDASALEYARRRGFEGEVLDVRGDGSGPQTAMAIVRIRQGGVGAIYGFSGGGYNARRVWSGLTNDERSRISLVVILGSPGVSADSFPGVPEIIIRLDPPAGHLAGPKALLDSTNKDAPSMGVKYRSLIGGYFSCTPYDKSIPASIRTNNPGAINGASWLSKMPGFVTTTNLDGTNHASIFETPEQGVAVWHQLMTRYRAAGAKTIEDIILRYGGGQANYASVYVPDVVKRTGLARDTEIKLSGDDATLLKFAKAMFRHEAGRDTPLSDAQILHGFKLARGEVASATKPAQSIFGAIVGAIAAWFRKPTPDKPANQGDPRWLVEAKKDLGFREVGSNLGIEKFIDEAHTGGLGDPWCAIFVNAKLEECGIPGTRSAMARSFERHPNFVRLSGPALGAIATFWRGSPSSGSGHVNFYAGTDSSGRNIGVGGNQSDKVSAAYMDMARHVGWFWPKSQPMPSIGPVKTTMAAVATGSEA